MSDYYEDTAISLLFSTPSLPSDTAAVNVSGSYAPSYSTLSLDIKYSTKLYTYVEIYVLD